ncbi:hypothetical protein AB0399_28370 [Streptomyces sp. NPDC088194]|uniref:hypothetical protein n=1 Tax=Streptomyces sp. NPDC088194 TaxID=3154931 RepID=UPI00344E84F1
MQLFWWLLGSAALLTDAASRGLFLYLGRLARRGVSGTEFVVMSLAWVFRVVLALRFAGIAGAFVLAADRAGTASAVLYGAGALGCAVTVVEVAQTLYAVLRIRHPRTKRGSGG